MFGESSSNCSKSNLLSLERNLVNYVNLYFINGQINIKKKRVINRLNSHFLERIEKQEKTYLSSKYVSK